MKLTKTFLETEDTYELFWLFQEMHEKCMKAKYSSTCRISMKKRAENEKDMFMIRGIIQSRLKAEREAKVIKRRRKRAQVTDD